MTLPKSVQAQIDQADSLYQEAYGAQDDPETAEQATEETEEAGSEESTAQPAEEQQPAEQEENRDSLYWQHRFQVLQGKYNAEVPALREEIRTLQNQLQQQPAQPNGKAGELADTISSQLSEEEMELLGPELVQVIQKLVGRQGTAEVDQLKQEVSSLKRNEQEHAEAEFWAAINSRVPDWQQLQSTAEARQWLTGYDRMTGMTRNQLLVSAQQSLNAYQVVEIFNQLRQDTQGNASRVPANKVTPQQSRATNAPQPQGDIWTRDSINQFYRDKTTGRYSEEEGRKLEDDLFKAQAEGRVY